jgi:hypothetical protein
VFTKTNYEPALIVHNNLHDPLEQFDVLALPIVGGGLTNLSAILALNVLVMSV